VKRRGSAGLAAGGALAVAAVAHAAPTIGTFAPLATRVAPALAGVGRQGHVALSFDDGPDPRSTPAILAALDRLGWTATFFMLGEMVRRDPPLAGEVAGAGHDIGVHGDVHRSMLWRRPAVVADDITRARDLIEDATGTTPRWFRPPYGHTPLGAVMAASRLGMATVLWTAWGRDWRAAATPLTVTRDVLAGRLDGGTILLHDSDCTSAPDCWRATLGALPMLATELHACGLEVGPLSEHGLRGGARRQPEAG
jgi:peptidoglycan/xylan/chitin deacetylase (PgdA/CDA1 family)